MAYLTLRHLFGGLMTLGFATAFVVPERVAQKFKPDVELIFAPVSRPSGAVARWLHDSLATPQLSADTRAAEVVKRENETLRSENAALLIRIDTLELLEQRRRRVGDVFKLCTPFAVASTDSGARASLGISGSSLQGLRDGMVALYEDGIAGRVEGAGVAGARVQLVTDTGFRVRVGFARFSENKFYRLEPSQAYAEGTGRGAMQIVGLTREMVKSDGLRVGDWVILNEPDWPLYLQGRALGKITAIGPRPDAPLFDRIVVEPPENLMRLTEVLVVTKQPGEGNDQ